MKKFTFLLLVFAGISFCNREDKKNDETSSTSKLTTKVEEKKDPQEIVQQLKKNFFYSNEDWLYQVNYEDFPQLSISKLKKWGIFRGNEWFVLDEFDHQSQNEKEVSQQSSSRFILNFTKVQDEQGYYQNNGETRMVGELKKVHCIEFTKEYTDCKFYFDNIVFDNSEFHPYDGSTNQVIVKSRNNSVFFVIVEQERHYFPAYLRTGEVKTKEINDSFRRAYREYRKDPTAPPPSKYGFDEEKMKAWEMDSVEGE